MRVRKEKDLEMAFVVDEEAIKRLDGIAAEVAGEPKNYSFLLYCSDGTKLEPHNVDEVLDFANTDKRSLTGISVATEYSKRPRIGLRLNTSGYSSVSYEIDAEDIDFPYIDARLSEWIESVRQWYSAFSFASPFTSFVSGIAWGVGFLLQIISSIPAKQTQLSGFWRECFFNTGTLLVLLAFTTKYVRRWLFPVGVFAIGQGKDRLRNLRTRQKNVSLAGLIGVILALGIGIVASVIGNHITGK